MLKQKKENFTLSPETVDALSVLCAQSLAEAEVERKDVLRLRLSLEEILEVWCQDLPGAKVHYRAWKRLGRQHIEISVEGPHIPQRDYATTFLFSSHLLVQSGLVPAYSYKNGCTCLSLEPPKKARLGFLPRIGIAVGLAVVLGALCGVLPQGVQTAALAVAGPLFDLFAGLLRAVASPLIFLSVCWGILGMGDITALGKVGKTVIARMVAGDVIVGTLMVLATFWLFPVTIHSQGGVGGGFGELYRMVLDIVPSNLVAPFLEGNALQIIFLGASCGIAILALGSRVSAIQELIGQLNELVTYFMAGIGKLLPIFVFLSIFTLLASGLDADLLGVAKIVGLVFVCCGVLLTVYVLLVSAKCKVKVPVLVKKMLPAFLIAVTTASSSAALPTSMETCEKDLGIPRNVAGFAIPLGQTIFMPGCVIIFLAVVMCMAQSYQVSITPMWLVTAVITASLLSLATPPVPGGSAGVYTILFTQLGVPMAGLALSLAIDSILDFVITSVNVAALQTDVVLAMDSIGELDAETLRREK